MRLDHFLAPKTYIARKPNQTGVTSCKHSESMYGSDHKALIVTIGTVHADQKAGKPSENATSDSETANSALEKANAIMEDEFNTIENPPRNPQVATKSQNTQRKPDIPESANTIGSSETESKWFETLHTLPHKDADDYRDTAPEIIAHEALNTLHFSKNDPHLDEIREQLANVAARKNVTKAHSSLPIIRTAIGSTLKSQLT